MTRPAAAGKRILVATGEPAMAMREVAATLRDSLGDDARKVPTRRIPDVVVRLAGRFDAEARGAAADLGFVKQVDNTRLREILGVEPRPSRDAVVAAGASIVERGLAT